MSHDHIVPFEGIILDHDFWPLPALVSLWMQNGTLNEYLKREFSQLSDRRKLNLVCVQLSHCQFVLIHDSRYSRWLLVLVIVRTVDGYRDGTVLTVVH